MDVIRPASTCGGISARSGNPEREAGARSASGREAASALRNLLDHLSQEDSEARERTCVVRDQSERRRGRADPSGSRARGQGPVARLAGGPCSRSISMAQRPALVLITLGSLARVGGIGGKAEAAAVCAREHTRIKLRYGTPARVGSMPKPFRGRLWCVGGQDLPPARPPWSEARPSRGCDRVYPELHQIVGIG